MENSVLQMLLTKSGEFLGRLEYLMVSEAVTILKESIDAPHHNERISYAMRVVNSPTLMANQAATLVAGGINIISTTIFDEPSGTAICTATDAQFLSQVATSWNAMAGIPTLV